MLHLFPGFQSYKVAHHFWQLQLFHSLLSTILVLAVFIMLLNHRRLKARNKDHKELFGYLQWLVEHDWTRKSTSLEDGLKTILDGLVKTLDERKKKKSPKKGQNIIPRLNATIMIAAPESGLADFRILAQDSSDPFRYDTTVPYVHSVAGEVVRKDRELRNSGLLVYVPWTSFTHGVAFHYAAEKVLDFVLEMRIIPTTYAQIDKDGQEKLGCLLCIRIPLDSGVEINLQDGRILRNPSVVLSLSSPRAHSLDDSAFDTARLVSRLLLQVFQTRDCP